MAILLLLASCRPAANTSIYDAFKMSDWEAIQGHLDAGTDMNVPDAAGNTPLHLAIEHFEFGHLEFRLVHEESSRLLADNAMVDGFLVATNRTGGTEVHYLVEESPSVSLSESHLTETSVYLEPIQGQPRVGFVFNKEGAQQFGELTRANVGKQIAIFLNGTLSSAPNIVSPIMSGRGELSGDFDADTAQQLADSLIRPYQVLDELLKRTHDIAITNNQGETPLDIARRRGEVKVVKRLELEQK